MAYQRFGSGAKPDAYIWSSGERLHFAAEGTAHDGSHYNEGIVETVFDIADTRTAQSLFIALYQHLTEDAGLKMRFHKKTGELKFKNKRP
jgi:hypothetical protein